MDRRTEDGEMKNQRRNKGQGLIEVVVMAIVFIVPIALFFIDVFAVVASNSINDNYVKNAARAAASQPNAQEAKAAAMEAIAKFKGSGVISISLVDCDYRPARDNGGIAKVTVRTSLRLQLPAPLPAVNNRPQFVAQAVETITGLPPAPHS